MSPKQGWYVNLPTPQGVQRWRIAYRQKQRRYGLVDWSKRTIWLRPNQTNAELADTLIHETIHIATGFGNGHEPTIETYLERIAAASTAALLKLGVVQEDD
jgi:hypothetical protein